MKFLLSEGRYDSQELDCSEFFEIVDGKETNFDQEILQLKTNKMPKGLVMLENFFDNQDRFKSEVKKNKIDDLEEINLGTEEAPKKVYIGRNVSPSIKKTLVNLLRKYRHVFSWSYDDLKAYNEDLFKHTIPLKENVKTFRQKQKPINPTLAPKMP